MGKKVKIVFGALGLLIIVPALRPAMAAVTISSTTALDTKTPALKLQRHESAAWSVTGGATGTIHLERSENLIQWESLGSSTTQGVVNWSGTVYSGENSYLYRFRVATITASSYITQLSDQDDFVTQVKNNKGIPILDIYDDSLRVYGQIYETGTIIPSTATTSGTSEGRSRPAYLTGTTAALEGSVLIATTPVAGHDFSVIVARAVADQTGWVGVAKAAKSTGSIVDVYYSGFVLARTTGTVNPGDTLVTSSATAGYLASDTTPTTGADMAVALSAGTSTGGLTKVRLR